MFCLATLISASAFAEGSLGYSLKTDEGFWRVDIYEKEAVREGVLNQLGNRIYLTSYWEEDILHMPFAQNQKDQMTQKIYDEKHSYWYGFMYLNFSTRVDVYHDLKDGTMRMVGKIGENLDFVYLTDVNKKGKRRAELYWTDKASKNPVEMSLRFDFTSDKQAGSCKGTLYADTVYEVAKFACKSDGKLMDAFYTSEQDVIAWLMHILIYPDDGTGNKKNPLAKLLSH